MATNRPVARYDICYCAFIDFLGFSSAVSTGALSVRQIVSAMRKARSVAGGDEDLISVTQFSDSVVLSAPASEDWAFLSLMTTSFFLCIELANHNVLLRGGVSKGELFHSESLVFGPAFLRAYELEQSAKSPKIIIDANLATDAAWPESMSLDEIAEFIALDLPLDTDGWRYVDYLSPRHVSEFDDGAEGLESHYRSLRRMITAHASSDDASIRAKYVWLDSKMAAVGR